MAESTQRLSDANKGQRPQFDWRGIAGLLELTTGDATHLAEPGDSWCIPGGTPHHARALADCVDIEVFSPVREDYLPQG